MSDLDLVKALGALEPGATVGNPLRFTDDLMRSVALSQAISLKRIADALEPKVDHIGEFIRAHGWTMLDLDAPLPTGFPDGVDQDTLVLILTELGPSEVPIPAGKVDWSREPNPGRVIGFIKVPRTD